MGQHKYFVADMSGEVKLLKDWVKQLAQHYGEHPLRVQQKIVAGYYHGFKFHEQTHDEYMEAFAKTDQAGPLFKAWYRERCVTIVKGVKFVRPGYKDVA